jgi:hypothetical protein
MAVWRPYPEPVDRSPDQVARPFSKIVAAGFGKLEKREGHDGADRVATDVLSPSVAAAVSKEPRHWAYRAAHRARYGVCSADRLHYRCRPSVSVLEVLESDESFVIQGWWPDS